MQDRLLKYKYAPYLIIFLFWNIIAVLAATFLFVRFADTYPDATWWGFFYRQSPIWYIWMFYTPIILWVVDWIKKKEVSVGKSVLIHLLVASLMFVAYSLLTGMHTLDLNQKLVLSFKAIFPAASRNFALNFASNCLIYLMIAFVGVGLQWYRSLVNAQQEKLQLQLHNSELHSQLVEAQLQTLTQQLQPHFLFNTLHSIASLVRTQQNKVAIQMIADFSELLRHSIRQGEDNFATIETEVAFIEKYLSIEKTRFQDRLEVKYQIDKQVKAALVPSLILQPFIENAIKHGIAPLTTKGCILLSITQENNLLDICIEDNGVGLKQGWNISANQGVGLKNSTRRLEQIYNQEYSLNLDNQPNGGTLVQLRLPVYQPIKPKLKPQNVNN